LNRWLVILITVILTLIILAGGCNQTPNISGSAPGTGSPTGIPKSSSPSSVQPASTAKNKPVTGNISTGAAVQAAGSQIAPGGGTVTVTDTASPLAGMALTVPAGSYTTPQQFKVSYAPITGNTFGEGLHPLTPLIIVDNGGQFSDKLITLKVPVKVPEDRFAMGFIFDEKTGKLSGLPVIAQDANSITIATRHFCSLLISDIEKAKLKKDIDSGFRPGIDDWQFPNWGSYIAIGGHCAGQSVTALWYYVTQPDGKNLTLNGRYDNNGAQPPTPDFWKDDSQAYRFVSTVHADINWDSNFNAFWTAVAGLNDTATWYMFAYAMQMTGEPQECGIFSKAGGGHDMVCYRIFQNNLYIADPNYPGNTERRIEWVNGQFKPYNSGANKEEIDAGFGKEYETIQYCTKSTTVDWDKIAQRWQEFKNKTAGNNSFPTYKIVWTDDKNVNHDLPDRYVSPSKLININTLVDNLKTGETNSLGVYREGKSLKWDAKGNYELLPGENKLGIWATVSVPAKDKDGNPIKKDKYIDFKYLTIIYTGLSIDPAALDGETNKEYTFTAKMASPSANTRFSWLVDGAVRQTDTATTFKTTFKDEGKHTVTLKALDETGKELGQIQCSATIKAAASPTSSVDRLKKIQGTKTAYGNFGSTVDDKGGQGHVLSTPSTNIPITWQGTKFSGSLTTTGNSPFNYALEGSVSPDGTTLVSWKLVITYATQPSTLELGNILLNDRNYFMGQGPDLKKYVTKFEAYTGVAPKLTLAWSLNNVNWDKSMINIGFE
jgi:hypothetical protein